MGDTSGGARRKGNTRPLAHRRELPLVLQHSPLGNSSDGKDWSKAKSINERSWTMKKTNLGRKKAKREKVSKRTPVKTVRMETKRKKIKTTTEHKAGCRLTEEYMEAEEVLVVLTNFASNSEETKKKTAPFLKRIARLIREGQKLKTIIKMVKEVAGILGLNLPPP